MSSSKKATYKKLYAKAPSSAKKRHAKRVKQQNDAAALKSTVVNTRGEELDIEYEPFEDERFQKIFDLDAPDRECQWTTLSGTQCTRKAAFHIDLIADRKILKVIPAPSSLRDCCTLCSQHLKVILGLSTLGIAHFLTKRFMNDDVKLIYGVSMQVSLGKDYNAFKQIFEQLIKAPSNESYTLPMKGNGTQKKSKLIAPPKTNRYIHIKMQDPKTKKTSNVKVDAWDEFEGKMMDEDTAYARYID
jgi:hypothetical protein